MYKIICLDSDRLANQKLKDIVSDIESIDLIQLERKEDLLDILNGYPEKQKVHKNALDVAKKAREILNKTIENEVAIEKKVNAVKTAEKDKSDQETQGKNQSDLKIKLADEQLEKAVHGRQKAEEFLKLKEKAAEQLEADLPKMDAIKCHLLLVDRSFIGNSINKWIIQINSQITAEDNKNLPIAITGQNENIEYIMQLLVPGILDYFVKPIDPLLLKQNLDTIFGKGSIIETEVFSVGTTDSVDVAVSFKIEQISEFEMTLKSNKEFEVNSFAKFFGNMFKTQTHSIAIGRCIKSEPLPDSKNEFLCTFSFVGLTAEIRQQLRIWMKQAYIKQKENES